MRLRSSIGGLSFAPARPDLYPCPLCDDSPSLKIVNLSGVTAAVVGQCLTGSNAAMSSVGSCGLWCCAAVDELEAAVRAVRIRLRVHAQCTIARRRRIFFAMQNCTWLSRAFLQGAVYVSFNSIRKALHSKRASLAGVRILRREPSLPPATKCV